MNCWPTTLLLSLGRLGIVRMENARPGKELIERSRYLFVGDRIRMREKNGSICLACQLGGDPIKIAFAVGCEAETFSPALRLQVDGKSLAFQIERQESLNPFRRIFRFREIVRIGTRPLNLKPFRQDCLVILVKREQPLRKKSADSLLDFRGLRMHQPVAKRIARCLVFFGSQSVPKLMQQSPRAKRDDKKCKGHDKGAECLGEQCLHALMILEPGRDARG